MKRLLLSLLFISLTTSVAFGLTTAFFSDTETSIGNILQAGAIDLKIDNTSYYNGQLNPDTTWDATDLDENHLFFNFSDLKPSDWGEDTISLHVNTNDAWACFNIDITHDDDGTCTGPELLDDQACVADNDDLFDGELGDQVHFVFWLDDGDNVLEDNETANLLANGLAQSLPASLSGALADSQTNRLGGQPGDPLQASTTYYIGKAWCFGNLTLDPVTQDGIGLIELEGTNGPDGDRGPGITCDGSSINNASQTDLLMGDLSFSAIQARNNPDYICPGGDPECQLQDAPANNYVGDPTLTQGLKKNGNPVDANRSDPNHAVDGPQGLVNPPEWYTLGFGGSITLQFDAPVGDGPGTDLIVYEVTGGRDTYPPELAKIEISQDNSTWYEVGTANSQFINGELEVDFGTSPISTFQYLRVTDVTDSSLHNSSADGFDLDAVVAKYGACTF